MSSGIASGLAPRVPQRQRGRDRVVTLMQAASAVFLEKGFEAATMTEIAARAGASIGSLYLFFPTKQSVAHAVLTACADQLSARLDALRTANVGNSAAQVADALFDELAGFLADHPAYAALIDVQGDDGWKTAVRARRREQIAALFTDVSPKLPDGQPERLALIVPQLMRITIGLGAEAASRGAILDELRTMLRRHLEGAGH